MQTYHAVLLIPRGVGQGAGGRGRPAVLFVCAGPIGFCDGGDSRKGGPERGFHSGPGGVWGGKVARPPGEAVVAGALARAHALERHPGSSGGVPRPWTLENGRATLSPHRAPSAAGRGRDGPLEPEA